MGNAQDNSVQLAVRMVFEGILKKGLSKEVAFKQQVTEDKTVSDIFQDEIDEENAKKPNGTIYSHEALFEIVAFFKSRNNEWASHGEIVDHLKQFYNKADGSFFGHIYRARTKYGILEYDEEKRLYRLKEKDTK